MQDVKVTRKGGNEAFVYFSDEATGYIKDYIKERKEIIPVDGHEDALFLSSQRRRISVRTVENLVKKYAQASTPLKHITPHKLRSTYGTALYQETGDIYLVADVLGHKDVNTTRKHYADMDQERKRKPVMWYSSEKIAFPLRRCFRRNRMRGYKKIMKLSNI